jgi:uncharacterized protein YjbI with pentapeptide repeats
MSNSTPDTQRFAHHGKAAQNWLALVWEGLGRTEPKLRLTEGMTGEEIKVHIKQYVNRCVKWQAHRRDRLLRVRAMTGPSRWFMRPLNRATGVFLSGVVGLSLLVATTFVGYWLTEARGVDMVKWLEPNTVLATLMSILIGAPVAFVIWRYRDQNTLWQIENQRKDINLKDFQKLAEWASGQHLQEDRHSTSLKRTEKETAAGKEITVETIDNNESTISPLLSHSISKRTGGESLQISAIYNLQAFLDGEYGRHFQRPTFQLVKSAWGGLVAKKIGDLQALLENFNHDGSSGRSQELKRLLEDWKTELMQVTHRPLGIALNKLLSTDAGAPLHFNAIDMPSSVLSGIETRYPDLKPWELAGVNLSGMQLQGANLASAHLQGAKLSFAKMHCTRLFNGQLQGADLSWTDLHSADLSSAQLQGALLCHAKLPGANLIMARLQGADLRGTFIDSATLLNEARYDKFTRFGRLKPGGQSWNDADYIEAGEEEQRWCSLGAQLINE